MKYFKKTKETKTSGTPKTRIIRKFAFFPICIGYVNDIAEYRWLEFIYIKQRLFCSYLTFTSYWLFDGYTNKKEYLHYKNNMI